MPRIVLILCFAIAIAACSDGGDSTSTPSTSAPPTSAPPAASATSPEGLWNGTTSTGRSIGGLVLDDGTFWFLYTVVGNPNTVAGLIQGSKQSQNGALSSANVKDFNLEGLGILPATVAGSYVEKQTLNGTISYQSGHQGTFTSTYDAAYESTPDVNAIAGTYSGLAANNESVTVTLSSTGEIAGSSSTGCTFAGSFSPRATGNVFNVAVIFHGGVCALGTNIVNGIAFYDATNKRLYSAGLDGLRTNGFIFIGTKP